MISAMELVEKQKRINQKKEYEKPKEQENLKEVVEEKLREIDIVIQRVASSLTPDSNPRRLKLTFCVVPEYKSSLPRAVCKRLVELGYRATVTFDRIYKTSVGEFCGDLCIVLDLTPIRDLIFSRTSDQTETPKKMSFTEWIDKHKPPMVNREVDWVYDNPHFIDTEDCMGNRTRYWRVFAFDAVTETTVCGTGYSPDAALAECKSNAAKVK